MSLQKQQERHEQIDATNIVLPFSALDHDMLALVGGKAANLGELTNADLPVPSGFCITTVAYGQVEAGAGLEPTLNALATVAASDTQQLATLAETARTCMLGISMPANIVEEITEAYRVLGNGEPIPVAVRSSATAEDLPFASFAGQQDTYLNIVGIDALLDAVKRCWASLWTDRAVSYRQSLGIDQHTVRLAVVVQRMIQSEVAGVMFTANPVTGKRRQAVIDANPGLGEAVVSGATNPDHFIVNSVTGEIVEQRLGDKRVVISGTTGGGTVRTEASDGSNQACLTDEQVRALAKLGVQVEAYYGAPQDTEWAIDADGKLWLTQSRPITTLYPLPANAPDTDDVLRVYFSINVAQGVFGPFTPMGRSIFRPIVSSVARMFGLTFPDQLKGPSTLVDAGDRLFFDVTPALRTSIGRKFLIAATGIIEARSSPLFKQLTTDPRLSLLPTPRWGLTHAFGTLLEKTRAPFFILRGWMRPSTVVRRMEKIRAWLLSLDDESTQTPPHRAADRLAALEQALPSQIMHLFTTIPPLLISGPGAWGIASRLLKDIAAPEELQIVLRGLSHNPTTEMDLQLWDLARRVQSNGEASRYVDETPLERQVQDYREGKLPSPLQQGLSEFLHLYGHRGVAEIDLGLSRWREDPSHILGALANYLHLKDPELAPNIQFERGAQEAEAMVTELTQRATRMKGRFYGKRVGFFLRRTRDLAGLREMPKFCIVLLLAHIRKELWPIGEELVSAGRLEATEDVFFLTLPELHKALTGEDMRSVVLDHRAVYEQEMQRRHIPRILLSDGTEPTLADASPQDGALRGTPASPGKVTAKARVILDPVGAQLTPGEILVAPSTDPGWTPLFLTAGGLVMEMGGAMSHGAVVAREYGIPAVVGVPAATEQITTGQQITVDGAAGVITLGEEKIPS
jgi:rifampicin phosphotransferase